MNNHVDPGTRPTLATREQQLLDHALAALQKTTGITGHITVATEVGAETLADATIELEIAGARHRYAAEIQRIDRFATLAKVKQQIARFGQPGLLIAPRITAATADQCHELDIQFIDTDGNAYLHGPGLFVLAKGLRDQVAEKFGATDEGRGRRAGTPTHLRAIFALLCRPELLNATYRDIAQAAGIALGAIGWVFFDLNNRGHIAGGKGKNMRRFLERRRLIDEWVLNYPIKLRPKLNPKRFRATNPTWWQQADITQYGALWGAEIAADKLTHYLKPATVTLYMRPENARRNLTRLVVDHQLRADPNGDIEILDTFWNFPPDDRRPDIVPPLLVYADLLATMDPRNHETAHMIFKVHLHDIGPET